MVTRGFILKAALETEKTATCNQPPNTSKKQILRELLKMKISSIFLLWLRKGSNDGCFFSPITSLPLFVGASPHFSISRRMIFFLQLIVKWTRATLIVAYGMNLSELKQGRIHGHQLRTGGQGRKCMFPHFSTRVHWPTDQPTNRQTDKASYRVACPQLKRRPYRHLSTARDWNKAGYTLRQSRTVGQGQ